MQTEKPSPVACSHCAFRVSIFQHQSRPGLPIMPMQVIHNTHVNPIVMPMPVPMPIPVPIIVSQSKTCMVSSQYRYCNTPATTGTSIAIHVYNTFTRYYPFCNYFLFYLPVRPVPQYAIPVLQYCNTRTSYPYLY